MKKHVAVVRHCYPRWRPRWRSKSL